MQSDLITSSTLFSLQHKSDGIFDVYGTIYWTGDQRQVYFHNISKLYRQGILSDGTASLPITLWEAEISSVSENVLYKFQNLKFRSFTNGTKHLTTTRCTTIYNSGPSFPLILSLIPPLTFNTFDKPLN